MKLSIRLECFVLKEKPSKEIKEGKEKEINKTKKKNKKKMNEKFFIKKKNILVFISLLCTQKWNISEYKKNWLYLLLLSFSFEIVWLHVLACESLHCAKLGLALENIKLSLLKLIQNNGSILLYKM